MHLLTGVALAVLPGAAYANAGIGFLISALPFMLVALLPAILIEGVILAPILRLPATRALDRAARANVRSTIYGFIFAIVIDIGLVGLSGSAGPEPTKVAVATMLVPFLFYSWWIEHRAIRRLEHESPRWRVALATGVGNLVTYAAMIGIALFSPLLPEVGSQQSRAQAHQALSLAAVAKTVVEEFVVENGRLPQDLDELDAPRLFEGSEHRFSLESDGTIVMELVAPDNPRIDGGYIRLTPEVIEDPSGGIGILGWTCSSPDLERAVLPSGCR